MSAPTYRMRRPPAALAGLVEWVWFFDDPRGGGLERRLPDGGVEIILHLAGEGTHTAGVREPVCVAAGPRAQPEVLEAAPGRLVGVHCRPGAARGLLGVPGREIRDLDLDLRGVWGPRAAELAERLAEVDDPDRVLEVLIAQLVAALRPEPSRRSSRGLVRAALETIDADPAAARIGNLVERSGVSWRIFTQTFEEEVGLTPKLYQRVRRLQGAVGELHRDPGVGLAALAAGWGYADQAHLVREFRALGDVSPAQYRNLAPEAQNHVPL